MQNRAPIAPAAPSPNPHLDLLFDQHPFGLALIGTDHRIARANRAFCDLTGYSPAELAKLTFVEITHPDDIGVDLQLCARLFAGEVASYQLPKRYVHKSGRIVSADLTATVLRDPNTRQIVAGVATVRPLPDDAPAPDPQSTHELARLRRAILD